MNHGLTETAGAGARTSWTAGAAGWADRAAAAIRADLSRAAMNRRVLHRLATLSERELKDIGLSRQDVADACVPGIVDPIDLLVGRRARTARRW